MRNESRNARVAARSSCSSRSRSSWAAAGSLLGVEVQAREGGVQVGDPPLLLRSARGRAPWRRRSCPPGVSGASSTSAAIASWAGTCGVLQVRGEHRRQHAPGRATTPTCRAPMVHPACWTRGSRISIAWEVSRSTVSPSPRPTSACGAIVQARSADGRMRQPGQAAGDQEAARRHLDGGGGRSSRASGRAASAASGTTDTVSGRRRRRPPPPLDQQQDQQEQGRRERGRQQGQRQVGADRRSVPVRRDDGGAARTARAAGTASTANGTCTTKIACQENASVSSPPATGPAAVPTTPAVTQAATPRRSPYSADQQLQAADQRQRAPDRLHAARRHQPLDRARPARTRPRTPANTAMPTALSTRRLGAGEGHRRRHGAEPQHQVERDQHPRDLPDRGVAGAAGCRAGRASPPPSRRAPAPRSRRAAEPRHGARRHPRSPRPVTPGSSGQPQREQGRDAGGVRVVRRPERPPQVALLEPDPDRDVARRRERRTAGATRPCAGSPRTPAAARSSAGAGRRRAVRRRAGRRSSPPGAPPTRPAAAR